MSQTIQDFNQVPTNVSKYFINYDIFEEDILIQQNRNL